MGSPHIFDGLSVAEAQMIDVICDGLAKTELQILKGLGATPELARRLLTRALIVDLASSICTNRHFAIEMTSDDDVIAWLRHALTAMDAESAKATVQ